jgi:hypothetical protein
VSTLNPPFALLAIILYPPPSPSRGGKREPLVERQGRGLSARMRQATGRVRGRERWRRGGCVGGGGRLLAGQAGGPVPDQGGALVDSPRWTDRGGAGPCLDRVSLAEYIVNRPRRNLDSVLDGVASPSPHPASSTPSSSIQALA